MISVELTSAVIFSVPLVGALVCFGITALDLMRTHHPVRRRVYIQAMAAYGVFALCWFMMVARVIFPEFHARAVPLFVPGMMLAYVFLYRLVRTSTDTGDGSAFPRDHFAPPVVMFSVLMVLWLALPTEQIARLVHASPASTPVAYVITGICFGYAIGYPVAALVRISRFRRWRRSHDRHPDRSRRPARTPHDRLLGRLRWAILTELVFTPVPVFGMLLGFEPFTRWGVVWIVAVLPSRIIYIVSCFDLLSDNYLVVEAERPGPTQSNIPSPQRLSRERVDHYIETRKPWLNPAFRIGDMAEDLFSNRAYVSAFINSEYGINFNRFVNGHRLGEVERLKAEAKRKKQRVPMLQLILNAGFSSYRSYLRAKEALTCPLDGDENEAV